MLGVSLATQSLEQERRKNISEYIYREPEQQQTAATATASTQD